MKRLNLLANPHKHLQPLKPIPQLKEQRQPLPGGICLDDQSNNLAALLPQFTPQGIFMITAEVPDNLLKIDRQLQCLLINRKMLISCHGKHVTVQPTQNTCRITTPLPPSPFSRGHVSKGDFVKSPWLNKGGFPLKVPLNKG